MAGYKGYSMSNNAVDAYEQGEMPLSKWTKAAMLEIVEASDELSAAQKRTISKLTAAQLKVYLTRSSWHHTSSHYNRTDFYAVDLDTLRGMTLEDIAATPAPAPKPKVELKREVRRCRYLTWEGSRKHPKAVEHFEECEIVGDWAMTSNGKKSTKANGFYFCR